MAYIPWSSNYALYLKDYLIAKCHTLDISFIDMKCDLKVYVGQFDLYFMAH